MTVPSGSQVTASETGDVDVVVKAKGETSIGTTIGPRVPSPAIAPFDAAKAKQHREAWAKHLGVPVEDMNSIGMKLVLIPPGEFDMGSTPEEVKWALECAQKYKEAKHVLDAVHSELSRHRVRINKPLYLGMYAVTQGDYEKVMGGNPSALRPDKWTQRRSSRRCQMGKRRCG